MFNDKDFKCLLSALSTFEWNSFHSPHPFIQANKKNQLHLYGNWSNLISALAVLYPDVQKYN